MKHKRFQHAGQPDSNLHRPNRGAVLFEDLRRRAGPRTVVHVDNGRIFAVIECFPPFFVCRLPRQCRGQAICNGFYGQNAVQYVVRCDGYTPAPRAPTPPCDCDPTRQRGRYNCAHEAHIILKHLAASHSSKSKQAQGSKVSLSPPRLKAMFSHFSFKG